MCRGQFSPVRREDAAFEEVAGERQSIDEIVSLGSRLLSLRQEKRRQAKELLAVGRARFGRDGLARFRRDERERVGPSRCRATRQVESESEIRQQGKLP